MPPDVTPQLHNKGPATVTNITLSLHVPVAAGGRTLLYLLELGTEGGITCVPPPDLNPMQVTHGDERGDGAGGTVLNGCRSVPAGGGPRPGCGAEQRDEATGAQGCGG